MKIGIDASAIESPKRTGVGNYLLYLLENMGKLFPENEHILYFNNTTPNYDFLVQKCFTLKTLKKPWFFSWLKGPLWNIYCLPKELHFNKVDIFFSPNFSLPFLWSKIKTVVTIYDISYEIHPEWFEPHWCRMIRKRSRTAAWKANVILTISDYSKREIIKYYGIDSKKINTIYLGVGEEFHPLSEKSEGKSIREKYGITGKYLLYVGGVYPKRNIPTLIGAFKNIARKLNDYKLVLVGVIPGFLRSDIISRIDEANSTMKEKRIIYIDYSPLDELIGLYQGAEMFVYLSTHEGFGLTVLEAMACGVPVIATKFASIPEVVGDAGIYVDPSNIEEISNTILKVLSDEKIRQTMREKGLERAKLFSWEKTAKETMDVFRAAVGDKT